ncbi:MAG TPA: DNA polymerase III subunit delta [Phycisphaerales bacterium]|nr:DNA polymerase III subunit delta [Phycisphaerales bacterium]
MAKRTSSSKTTEKTTPPVCVVFGEDAFLVAKEAERRLDVLLDEEERMTAFSEPKAADVQIADVLDELRTVPFLAPRRVVLIKDAEPFIKNYSSQLEAYLESPSPTGVLLMTMAGLDKRTRFSKILQKIGGTVEVASIKSSELPRYVTAYAQQEHGIALDVRSSRLLVELTGDDPGRLCREMDKLALYVAPRKTVTPEDIEQLIGRNRMFNAFEVIDGITRNNPAQALTRLQKMFAADRESQYRVVGAFGYHFRKLFSARALMAKGMNPQQAMQKAGVFWAQKEAFSAQLSRLTLEEMAWVLAELGRIDHGIKTGRTTAPVAMERLAINLFEMQQKSGSRR